MREQNNPGSQGDPRANKNQDLVTKQRLEQITIHQQRPKQARLKVQEIFALGSQGLDSVNLENQAGTQTIGRLDSKLMLVLGLALVATLLLAVKLTRCRTKDQVLNRANHSLPSLNEEIPEPELAGRKLTVESSSAEPTEPTWTEFTADLHKESRESRAKPEVTKLEITSAQSLPSFIPASDLEAEADSNEADPKPLAPDQKSQAGSKWKASSPVQALRTKPRLGRIDQAGQAVIRFNSLEEINDLEALPGLNSDCSLIYTYLIENRSNSAYLALNYGYRGDPRAESTIYKLGQVQLIKLTDSLAKLQALGGTVYYLELAGQLLITEFSSPALDLDGVPGQESEQEMASQDEKGQIPAYNHYTILSGVSDFSLSQDGARLYYLKDQTLMLYQETAEDLLLATNIVKFELGKDSRSLLLTDASGLTYEWDGSSDPRGQTQAKSELKDNIS